MFNMENYRTSTCFFAPLRIFHEKRRSDTLTLGRCQEAVSFTLGMENERAANRTVDPGTAATGCGSRWTITLAFTSGS